MLHRRRRLTDGKRKKREMRTIEYEIEESGRNGTRKAYWGLPSLTSTCHINHGISDPSQVKSSISRTPSNRFIHLSFYLFIFLMNYLISTNIGVGVVSSPWLGRKVLRPRLNSILQAVSGAVPCSFWSTCFRSLT